MHLVLFPRTPLEHLICLLEPPCPQNVDMLLLTSFIPNYFIICHLVLGPLVKRHHTKKSQCAFFQKRITCLVIKLFCVKIRGKKWFWAFCNVLYRFCVRISSQKK